MKCWLAFSRYQKSLNPPFSLSALWLSFQPKTKESIIDLVGIAMLE